MGVFVVAYDMNKERKGWENDRDKLREKIKSLGGWIMLSESAYAIDTGYTAAQVMAVLKPLIDSNDQVYVITLTAPWAGWGTKLRNDWLIKRLGPAEG
jgi:hypothetical protein